jgi:hypothetical protein
MDGPYCLEISKQLAFLPAVRADDLYVACHGSVNSIRGLQRYIFGLRNLLEGKLVVAIFSWNWNRTLYVDRERTALVLSLRHTLLETEITSLQPNRARVTSFAYSDTRAFKLHVVLIPQHCQLKNLTVT